MDSINLWEIAWTIVLHLSLWVTIIRMLLGTIYWWLWGTLYWLICGIFDSRLLCSIMHGRLHDRTRFCFCGLAVIHFVTHELVETLVCFLFNSFLHIFLYYLWYWFTWFSCEIGWLILISISYSSAVFWRLLGRGKGCWYKFFWSIGLIFFSKRTRFGALGRIGNLLWYCRRFCLSFQNLIILCLILPFRKGRVLEYSSVFR